MEIISLRASRLGSVSGSMVRVTLYLPEGFGSRYPALMVARKRGRDRRLERIFF